MHWNGVDGALYMCDVMCECDIPGYHSGFRPNTGEGAIHGHGLIKRNVKGTVNRD